MVSRTREKLIEVARQLFAYKGVDNTTMSDIATASDKGRRTIYTYFKSKREIYEATIESDSEHLVQRLRELVGNETSSVERIKCFLRYRLDLYEMPVNISRGVSIDSLLNLDFKRIDRVRHMALTKEKELLREIIEDGIADGSFDAEACKHIMPVIQFILQGVDMSIAQDNFKLIDVDRTTYKTDIIEYITKTLINN